MYASSDVNIVMIITIIAERLERLTVDLKVVGSSPAWELRYFSE